MRLSPTLSPALLALCAEELRSRFPQIEAAAARGDLVALRQDAHALRGVAANFGLPRLAGLLGALEAAAIGGNAEALRAALAPLPASVAEALVVVGGGAT
jgi:HPt (histidine-containing phosphotransfer) domain-containing protein